MDSQDYIHVWDLRTSSLLCILNRFGDMKVIKDLQFVNDGHTMAARHKEGITFWDLKQTLPRLRVSKTMNGISEFLLSKDKQEITYCNEFNQIVHSHLSKKGLFNQINSHESNIREMTLIGDGDVLLKSDVYLEDLTASIDLKKETDVKPSFYNLVFLDLSSIFEQDNQEDSDFSDDIFTRKNLKKTTSRVLYRTQTTNQTGKYLLLETPDEITSHNLVCSKDLCGSQVFENSKTLEVPDFEKKPDALWEGVLLVGTITGSCYRVDFHLTKTRKFEKNISKIFDSGRPRNPTIVKPDILSALSLDKGGLGLIYSMTEANEESAYVTHDIKRFLNESLDIAIIAENKVNPNLERKILVYVKSIGQSHWKLVEFMLKGFHSFSGTTYFRVHRMKNGKKHSTKKFKFYLSSHAGIGLVSVDAIDKTPSVDLFFEKNISKPGNLSYSPEFDLFLIPIQNTIEIWDGGLQVFIHQIGVESEILSFYYAHTRQDHRLLVYERTVYQEFDLESFRVVRREEFGSRDSKSFEIPLNLDFFEANRSFHFPHFQRAISDIRFVKDSESFGLFEFPFTSLPRCFSHYNYKQSVLRYADYYFGRLASFDFSDIVYGPLNPLVFCVYHNDVHLLEEVLKRHRYPKSVSGFHSPLSFAFKHKSTSSLQHFYKYLAQAEYSIIFSRLDFQCLLKADSVRAHDLAQRVLLSMDGHSFPLYLNMHKKKRIIGSSSNLLSFLTQTKAESRGRQTSKARAETSEVDSFSVPFKYSFETGSMDSLVFLEKIGFSESNRFVDSEWQEIINHKWNRVFSFYVVKSLVLLMYMSILVVEPFVASEYFKMRAILQFTFLSWLILFAYSIVEIVAFCFVNYKA